MKKMLGILLVLVCISAGSAYGAALEISCGDCANAAVGSEISCTVSMNSAPNEVATFGFDLLYNPDVLSYISFTKGTLAENRFAFFEVNEQSSGNLRCGGFETGSASLPAGVSGEFLHLTFQVKAKGDCGSTFSNLADDFKCWPANPPIVPKVSDGQSFTVKGNSTNGTVVGMVSVTEDNNQTLSFSITDGNTDSVFAINSSGLITVRDSSKLNCSSPYLLKILVSGCTGSTETTVTVNTEKTVKGNVNNDCKTDLRDGILSLQIFTGIQSDSISLAADVNKDFRIGMEEAIHILRDVAGIQ